MTHDRSQFLLLAMGRVLGGGKIHPFREMSTYLSQRSTEQVALHRLWTFATLQEDLTPTDQDPVVSAWFAYHLRAFRGGSTGALEN